MKDIPGYPSYAAFPDGRVWRKAGTEKCKRGRFLKPVMSKNNGYLHVALSENGRVKLWYLHQLIALVYHGERPLGHHVCHYDGNKLNNSAQNLRYDTPKGNAADNVRIGKHLRGMRSGTNKYFPEQIRLVRRLRLDGYIYSDIVKRTGIPMGTIQGILDKRIWAWLDD